LNGAPGRREAHALSAIPATISNCRTDFIGPTA
jgi:hypothetical protein